MSPLGESASHQSPWRVQRPMTTAYHPIANGLLSPAARDSPHEPPPNVSTGPPATLFGVGTALKDNLHCSRAGVCHVPETLPGEFFASSTDSVDPASYVHMYVARLKKSMQQLQATPACTTPRPVYVSTTVPCCTHVLIHHDTTREPLQQPYDGPFEVRTSSQALHNILCH